MLVMVLTACGGSSNEKLSVHAGQDQHVLVGSTATLYGTTSSSTAAPPTPTSILWELLERPAGSKATLSNADKLANTSFTPDVTGTYRLSLSGTFAGSPAGAAKQSSTAFVTVNATVGAPAVAVPPSAHAGMDQIVKPGTRVTLDGSASADANGDLLTATWAFTSMPPASTAALTAPSSLHPSFVADLPGTYALSMLVSDGKLSSNVASVSITAVHRNAAPVAHAGPAQNVTTGTQVTLDGSASSDADGDPLTARWALSSQPKGSAASLASPSSFHPTFTADMAGTYTAALVVNDGQLDSEVASVTITAAVANVAPVAHAGPAQEVTVGTQVMLNGLASTDANGDRLTAQWTLTSKPSGSSALLFAANTFTPAFVADVAGSYTVSLVVNDGALNSAAHTVTVTAIAVVVPPPVAPPACQGPNCPI